MSSVITVMTLLLASAMIVAALVAIRAKGLPVAILAAGLVGLFASVLFIILAAPDVAMTQAAIGSGLSTFLFFFVLGRVRGMRKLGDEEGEFD
jgi:energy-converting hydrogenase B subunit D